MAKLQTETKICKGLFHLLFILPIIIDIVSNYHNNFNKFKHIIYSTLLDIQEDINATTVFPQFLEQVQSKLYFETNLVLDLRTECVINLQQVGVANAATN